MPARRLIVLGSTGSIGVNTLAVVDHLNGLRSGSFEVVGLAAGANAEVLRHQALRFGVKHVAIAQAAQAAALAGPAYVYAGPGAALELIESIAKPGDLVVGAMVGSAGVPATLAAIERGCDIALANKETLVAAGSLVMPLVRQKRINLLPIDSEHSAIFQCLLAGRSIREVQRLIITASGGPFRTWSRQRLERATVDEALNHPTWNMGPKVTIDSATMMNKALEIIEAHWLFDLPPDKIEVIVHRHSIVHSFVEFVDGSVVAQLGPPDMRMPIQYALTWPHRAAGIANTMDWKHLRTLEFEQLDESRFAGPRLARAVIESGGTSGAILNAANESAVAAFLQGQIRFNAIAELVEEALQAIDSEPVHTIEQVMEADQAARDFIARRLAGGQVTNYAASQ